MSKVNRLFRRDTNIGERVQNRSVLGGTHAPLSVGFHVHCPPLVEIEKYKQVSGHSWRCLFALLCRRYLSALSSQQNHLPPFLILLSSDTVSVRAISHAPRSRPPGFGSS